MRFESRQYLFCLKAVLNLTAEEFCVITVQGELVPPRTGGVVIVIHVLLSKPNTCVLVKEIELIAYDRQQNSRSGQSLLTVEQKVIWAASYEHHGAQEVLL